MTTRTLLFPLLSALLLLSISEAEVAPSRIAKVVQLLEDLQAKAIDEGKAEAETYDKFACFCKDMSKEKTTAIEDATVEVDTLRGNIESNQAERETADEDAAKAEKEIQKLHKEIKEAKAERKQEEQTFLKNQLDLEKALRSLRDAIDALKASEEKVGSISLMSVRKTVRSAVALADALGLIRRPGALKDALDLIRQKTVQGQALVQDPDFADQDIDTSGDGYEFKSGSVTEILEELKTSFKEQLTGIEDDEAKAKEEHEGLMETKQEELKSQEEDLTTAKEKSDTATKEIARDTSDATLIQATLTDDQAYLLDLAKKCESKAKLWDQRTEMRTEEISAIGTAISILKELDAKKEEGGAEEEGLVQKKAQLAAASADVTAEPEEPEEDDEEDESAGISFLQAGEKHPVRRRLSSLTKSVRRRGHRAAGHRAVTKKSQKTRFLHHHRTGGNGAVRARVASLLHSRALTLKSQTLESLAAAAGKDPFAKIKKLIQELIERLLQEAADEASHKGWCDEQMGKAKQQRGIKAADIKKLNTELEGMEAKIAKLTDEVDTLGTELAELKDALSKAAAIRKDEKAENEAAAKEAREAKEAVEKAMDVLVKFYKKAAKGAASAALVQKQTPGEDAPDAGFSEGYKGQQGGGGGVIGMLEVIVSDFEREAREADEMEKQQAADFLAFERESKVSIGQKETAKESMEAELSDTEGEHADGMKSLREDQESLDAAITELEELRPSCVDTGESPEERAAKREAEIEALREALKILDEM